MGQAINAGGPADCGADDAWHALQGLLPVGTEVILKGLPGEDATDRYGRTLANIYVERGGQLVNVSMWLAEEGWARTLRSYPTVETDHAEALVEQAQAAHRGLWASCTMIAAYPDLSG
jgi:endonuclease YncB( thermonuclease family)